ncbi:hypothetical protein IMSAGC014_01597 [Bacteroidaceae bacterium]|nr:hypothetical protein IMSAGC014_01597 [Bacteroidaceae bacterium]
MLMHHSVPPDTVPTEYMKRGTDYTIYNLEVVGKTRLHKWNSSPRYTRENHCTCLV